MRNKFESLSTQVKGNIDVLMVSEIKIDDSFLVSVRSRQQWWWHHVAR